MIAHGSLRRGALGAALLLGACSSGLTPPPPLVFNRPTSVAHVCFDTATGDAVAITECALDDEGAWPASRALFALVLQTTRGEVAAIDLTAQRVIDSDQRVPGFTFVAAGDTPSAIVVPRTDPECSYVANAGARTISVIETRRFRTQGGSDSGAFHPPVQLPGRPVAMAMDATDTALWVALGDTGEIAVVPLDAACEPGEPVVLPLDITVPAGVADVPGADPVRSCGFGVAPAAVVSPRTPAVDDMALPRPAEIVADPVLGQILVADASLPLVHRFDAATRAPLAPIATGSPVRALALTPRVPDVYVEGASAVSRYLYAIDAVDGSVMVIDYSDEAAPDFGAVIAVDSAGARQPDRIPLTATARDLAVIDTGGDTAFCTTEGDEPSSQEIAQAGNLRGVFVAVALSDGSVRIIDVLDRDAPCRGVNWDAAPEMRALCSSTTDIADLYVYVRRHRPRIGSAVRQGLRLTDGPSFVVGASTLPVSAETGTGGGGSGATPALGALTPGPDGACPLGMAGLFIGIDDTGAEVTRLCALGDPFAAVAEQWQIASPGIVPGTASTSGNFAPLEGDPARVVLAARTDFCARGVLGSEDTALLDPAVFAEGEYAGDMLVVQSALPSSTADVDRCQALAGLAGSSDEPEPIYAPIRRARSHRAGLREPYVGELELVLAAPLARSGLEGATVQDLVDCYDQQLVSFEVRSSNGYVVVGSRTGMAHRVVEAADGSCTVVDATATTRVSRALFGREYDNGRVRFVLGAPPAAIDAELRFTLGGAPPTLAIDFGAAGGGRLLTLLSDVVWSDVDRRLYVLDAERQGLSVIGRQSASGTYVFLSSLFNGTTNAEIYQ